VRLRLLACAGLLCALPASGSNALLTPPVIQTLTSIDEIPSQIALNTAFGSPAAFDSLKAIADDPTVDLGIALRAIRALPAYCPPAPQACGSGPVHDELISLLGDPATARTPQELLRLRATVEALGDTRSGLDSDVNTLMGFINNGSRDVRATVVGALRKICSKAAISRLSDYFFRSNEPSLQVKFAITAALRDLAQCPGG
jgi:hypothetical protein